MSAAHSPQAPFRAAARPSGLRAIGTIVLNIARGLSTSRQLHILPLSEVPARRIDGSQPGERVDWRYISTAGQLHERPPFVPRGTSLADITAKAGPCDLCGVVYAPAGPVSVIAILRHLEFDCPRSPIGRRLDRLDPLTESELRVLDGNR